VFSLGVSVPELEKLIVSRYPDWTRSDQKRALNNRKDVALTPSAQSPYLQAISISYEDKTLGITRTYDFGLTSPLSGSRVHSIVYVVQANIGNLLAIEDWTGELHSRWGAEHGGMRSKTRARATYFFDAEWRLVENAGDKCAPVYPALYRLDEKPIANVMAAADLLKETGCAFSRDNFVRVRDGIVVKSTFYTVDLQLGVDDVARPVVFGVR
jgi:ketosteroid isomerase-like protein